MACCDSISRGEQISRASLRRTSTGSRCGSINARGRPWASKPLPIDYEQCCSDQLNPQPKADKGEFTRTWTAQGPQVWSTCAPFTKPQGVEIAGHRSYTANSQEADHEDHSHQRRAVSDSY